VVDFFRQNLNFITKNSKIVLCHPLGDLGVTYAFHLWLVGKRVVDFLLVLIEPFSPALTVERILVEIVVLEREWITLSAKFRGKLGSPTNVGLSKLESLHYHVCLRDPTFSRFYQRGASGARVLAVIVCLSVCLCVCVTRQFCIETVKRRITQTMSRDSSVSLVYRY